MKNTIFRKLFIGHLAASFAVLAVMSMIFVLAIKTSISHWNRDEANDMIKLLVPVIAKVNRLNGTLDPSALESAVLPYTTDSMYVYIFDGDRKPVLLLNRGQRVTQKTVEQQVGSIGTFLSFNTPVAVKDNGQFICYLSVNSQDFLTYKANRQFIATMRSSIAAGVVTAILIALFISIFISKAFSKQAASLVDEISSLGNGKRNIVFTHSNTAEFDMIASSEEKLQNQLGQEESLRRQWMLDVSHDLRTPVTAVKVQLEAISDGVLSATKARINSLLAELTHIERLVNNLHDLSRYESPEMKPNLVLISPQEFTDAIGEQFSLLAAQKNLSCSFECTCVEQFAADEFLLQRCVANIVQNAIKYTESGGKIIFKFFKDEENNIVITTANTGKLSAENLKHVFDRLYRGDKSRTDGGSGLGLSIAKAIMALHHGTISVENKDDMVLFTIKFPFEQKAAQT